MRNPGENSEARVEGETTSQGKICECAFCFKLEFNHSSI